ncbi:hypothetical protein BN1723_015043, partial [Verticillium longisporum]
MAAISHSNRSSIRDQLPQSTSTSRSSTRVASRRSSLASPSAPSSPAVDPFSHEGQAASTSTGYRQIGHFSSPSTSKIQRSGGDCGKPQPPPYNNKPVCDGPHCENDGNKPACYGPACEASATLPHVPYPTGDHVEVNGAASLQQGLLCAGMAIAAVATVFGAAGW